MGAAVVPAILVGTAVSAGLGVVGAIQEGQAAQQQADYQRAVARNNAIIAEQKAQDALERGQVEESRQRLRTLHAVSSSRANAAARGVVVDQGSALDIAQDIAMFGEQDALTIRSNSLREARAFRQQATDFTAQQGLLKAQGQSAGRQAALDATSSLVGGATSVASKWYWFKDR